MAADIKWVDGHIEIKPPKHPKKLTGTRFASIMGLNPWSTPFEIWCAVTRTWEKPFEDTIYTAAGKVIEPKQAEYMRTAYVMDNLRTPTDVWGPDYFKKTFGDFFPDIQILGGAWDYLLVDDKGKPITVLEMKTTKRSEDWSDDIPEYYALQAALYAYLLGVDDVIMVCSLLSPADYEHPEAFVPSVKNTITRPFKVSERYPDFGERVQMAQEWWHMYVETGISPDYDEKRDAEILKALRTHTVDADADIETLIREAEALRTEIDAHNAEIADKEKKLKALTEKIKEYAKEQFRPGDKEVTIPGSQYIWKYAKSQTTKLDEKRLKADGLYDIYATTTDTYRLTVAKKEDK